MPGTIAHVYGLTETAPFITICEVRPEHAQMPPEERAERRLWYVSRTLGAVEDRALLEIIALVAKKRSVQIARVALWGSAVVGIFGFAAILKAADKGGDLVYGYAGGVGTRSGDTADVNRLYLAGVYQAAQQARAQHDSARAAALFAQLEREFPNDTNVRLLAIESLVRDKDDGRAALTALSRFPVRADDRRQQLRIGFLKVDAYVAAGKPDSARAVLEQLRSSYPDMQARIGERLRMIGANANNQ